MPVSALLLPPLIASANLLMLALVSPILFRLLSNLAFISVFIKSKEVLSNTNTALPFFAITVAFAFLPRIIFSPIMFPAFRLVIDSSPVLTSAVPFTRKNNSEPGSPSEIISVSSEKYLRDAYFSISPKNLFIPSSSFLNIALIALKNLRISTPMAWLFPSSGVTITPGLIKVILFSSAKPLTSSGLL